MELQHAFIGLGPIDFELHSRCAMGHRTNSRLHVARAHYVLIALILALTCAIVLLGLFLAGQRARSRNHAAKQLLQRGVKLIAPDDVAKQSVFAKLIFGDNRHEFVEIIHVDSIALTEQEILYLGLFPRLTTVLLRECPTAQAALDKISALPTIRRLHIQGGPTLDFGSIAHMPNLEECVFDGITWSAGSLDALCTIPSLKSVSLTNGEIDQQTILVLAKCDRVRTLDLADSRISKDGLLALSHVKSLRSFSAPRSNICAIGLKSLSGLGSLEYIDLRDTKIDDASISHLHQSHSLRHALFQGTQVTSQGISEFQQAIPECKVWSDY